MGWRYRKRIKILPGIHINISKSGISTNVGIKGASVTFGSKGTYVNTGLPGTGLYRRDKVSESNGSNMNGRDTIQSRLFVEQQEKASKKNPNKRKHNVWSFLKKQFSKSDEESCSYESKEYEQNAPIKVVDNKQETSPTIASNKEKTEDIISKEELGSISVEEVFSEVQERNLEQYDPKRDLEYYRYPTLDLLKTYDFEGKPYLDMDEQNANKNRIVELLLSFAIEISSIKATVGPRVTLYEITLWPGINVSKIRGLEDNIALALHSHDVQIIGPIPDKGTIGIEVPNIKPTIVSMESVLNSRRFQETTMELPCAIGKTNTNEVFMFDLTKASHILIGGSTGQGKSVIINAIITSLLYKKHPAELKLVLMDPSGLELSPYSRIANHFLASLPDEPTIISNNIQAEATLNSLCAEMDARYELLMVAGERNIKDYNKKFIARRLSPDIGHKFMPYIVVIIDEYSDYIMTAGKKIEQSMARIAQKARAVGIHMIISTKRPTNDIITGTIKENFPTRISFRVPERIDSQVILDCNGAENLLGDGDMLYRAGKSIDCIRVQCAFVDTSETMDINCFISNQQGYQYPFELPAPYFEGENFYAKYLQVFYYQLFTY